MKTHQSDMAQDSDADLDNPTILFRWGRIRNSFGNDVKSATKHSDGAKDIKAE